ncbi:MAG: hypothetical protein HYV27_10585 [Candidatus Hydrogenedentes bacterium]|nr:hypothetical protein [Candidatus Hydrogenedentota bacterium]
MNRAWSSFWIGALLLGALSPGRECGAGETDQFMTWGVELKDSAEPLNAFFNERIEAYLDRVNSQAPRITEEDELTRRIFQHFFGGLFSSTMRSWLHESSEIDRFPTDEVSDWTYQRQSILRGFHFPFLLPMAQTIRIGEVYLGIDKIGHFFGFGRRYYQRYQRYVDAGLTEAEAEEKMIQWGLFHESYTVGGLVDGIFSKGDLEANYQGFRLARALCGGAAPHIVNRNGAWVLTRPVDLRDYVTPWFDESYNVSLFTQGRWDRVRKVYTEEYCVNRNHDTVQERFHRYAAWEPSLAQRMAEQYIGEQYPQLQAIQNLNGLCDETR